MNKRILSAMTGLVLVGSVGNVLAVEKWFTLGQVVSGQGVFQQHCVSCHGSNAEANVGWQQASGTAAAPPLNGTGHSSHHSPKQLKKTIQQGSIQIGGSMPAFGKVLDDAEIDSAIAFFQSKWSDRTYTAWADKFKIQAVTNKTGGITELLRSRVGDANIPTAVETEIEGVYQTQLGDKYAYLIEGGRYVFVGELIDLAQARNLTKISQQADAKNALSSLNDADAVIYPAVGEALTVLTVFTDTSCGYCQKLHKEVGYLQEAGISVRYFPFPRGGSQGPGYSDLKSVWCADDRLEAMNIAKGVSNGQLGDGDCAQASMVDKGFELGRKIGITGTPALFSSSGTKFNGYVPHKELISRLLAEL